MIHKRIGWRLGPWEAILIMGEGTWVMKQSRLILVRILLIGSHGAQLATTDRWTGFGNPVVFAAPLTAGKCLAGRCAGARLAI